MKMSKFVFAGTSRLFCVGLFCGGVAGLFAGCADDAAVTPPDGGHKDGPTDGPRRDQVSGRDGSRETGGSDLRTDTDPNACRPGCHWDCFGGHLCDGGKIYQVIYAPVDCCNDNDPWPMPGPVCTEGVVVTTCASGHGCTSKWPLDARYQSCIQQGRMGLVAGAATNELLGLLCDGSAPKLVGASCASDADCRPADVSVSGALTCDATSQQCVETSRPAAPADYQASCGITPASSFSSASEALLPAPASTTAPLCHAIGDSSGSCTRQARTYACSFDEDCPAGSICLCGSFTAGPDQGKGVTFCAAATDRTTVAGRTAGLVCP